MGNRNSSSQSQRPPIRKRRPGETKRRAYWMWKPTSPSSKDIPEWIHYSDIENEIIEDAFSDDKPQVFLNNDYIIDLKNLLQISRIDPNRQSQKIKREMNFVAQEYIREERFHLPESKLKIATISGNNNDRHPPIIEEWAKKHGVGCDILFNLFDRRKPEGGLVIFEKIIKMASEGIIQHGTELGKKEEAEWISNQLLQAYSEFKKDENFTRIEWCCISLYTRESFLYKSINKMLREEDPSQVESLAPFCYLLNGFLEYYTYYYFGLSVETYRGVNLTPEMLEEYKNAEEKEIVFTWQAFTSTSRSREKAEAFGNTLFVFPLMTTHAQKRSGRKIESFSVFPNEQEVLHPANSRFMVDKIEENPENGKTIIYLK